MSDEHRRPEPGVPGLSPEQEAALMVDLLDSLEQSDSREAAKLRKSLLAVVDEFRARRERGDELESVKRHTARGLAALETQAAATIARATWKLHDRTEAESRRVGVRTPQGQALAALAESLALYAEALEQLVDAARLGDPELRERALALVLQARDLLPHPAPRP